MRSIHRHTTAALALAAWLGTGCPAAPPAKDSGGLDDPASAPCDPALGLGPAGVVVEVHDLLQLQASGGTGARFFSLQEDASGASLGATTGAYVAGSTAGGVDRVRLEDAGCQGSAEVEIGVVAAMTVAPAEAELPPGTTLEIAVSGGSGDWRCSLAQDRSGAAVDGSCAYTAGAAEGVDQVRVEDRATGAVHTVLIDVSDEHGLTLAGRGGVWMGVGSTWAPTGTGGSGSWELEVVEGPLELDGDAIVALAEGTGTVRVQDRYAPSLVAEAPVEVVAARAPVLDRDGERSGEGVALGLGDIDGDGFNDAALGFIELSEGAWFSGGVLIYRGTVDGLDPEPARTIGGTDPLQTLGRALAVADLDQDGHPELIVGSDRTDRGATNSGAVFIYGGEAGSLFSEEPIRRLHGTTAYSRLGASLAICDFDGDGVLDLAAGALDDTDEAVAEPADEQGAVHLFLGAGGFSDRADRVLYGVVPTDEGWEGQAGMHLATALAAGDFDGDGLCDLAAGAPDAESDDGLVLIWRGDPTEGLLPEPAAVLWGDGGTGRRLAAGDVDADGRADLFIGSWSSSAGAEEGGAARLHRGDALLLDGDPGGIAPTEASWSRAGQSRFERLGTSVDLGDLDGDGFDDLIIGSYRDELTLLNAGTVTAFPGSEVAWVPVGTDASGEAPWITVEGLDAGDRLGQAVGHLGDLDGDGMGEMLALAGYDSAHGIETGAPYLLRGVDGSAPELLEMPGEAAGQATGTGLTLFDLDGDGLLDLLTGAPEAGDAQVGANAGVLLAWWGTGTGAFAETWEQVLGHHDTHGATDRFAAALSSAGDFDGDGYEDLAVVARKDGRPSSFDEALTANPEDCDGSRSQAGGVYIYRGGPDGIELGEPAFAFYGPASGGFIDRVAGGFDRDGDGYGDLLVGSEGWGTGGGVAVLQGQPADPDGLTTILCEAETWTRPKAFDRMGASIAVLGDLDGDGCDEVAVGSSGEDLDGGTGDQGVVRILWGTCGGVSELSTLSLDFPGSHLGSALAAGQDLDGDGVGDLAVGAADYDADGADIGAFFVVSGAWLLGVGREAHDEGELPLAPEWELLLATEGEELRVGLSGSQASGQFGATLALVADPEVSGRGMVAVGSPMGAVGGTALAGGVELFGFGEQGLEAVPWGIVVGESASPGGELGRTLFASEEGTVLLVGAPASDAGTMDGGAVVVVELE